MGEPWFSDSPKDSLQNSTVTSLVFRQGAKNVKKHTTNVPLKKGALVKIQAVKHKNETQPTNFQRIILLMVRSKSGDFKPHGMYKTV